MSAGAARGFSNLPAFTATSLRQSSELQMGLFDGVKDAFSAPALERTTLDAERETPIDRWMGWSAAKDSEQQEASGAWDLYLFFCGNLKAELWSFNHNAAF